jgi:hypothetical protein
MKDTKQNSPKVILQSKCKKISTLIPQVKSDEQLKKILKHLSEIENIIKDDVFSEDKIDWE